MGFVLKGGVCHSKDIKTLETIENGYLVCENGISKGVFQKLPEKYAALPVTDYGDRVIIPGLTDLHVHASQFALRGLGMDMELLDWLNSYTFPEEAKYKDLEYAQKAYSLFVKGLMCSPNTRACVHATIHTEATVLLMEQLEASGLVTLVGKVNMDRNSPDILCEKSADSSVAATRAWIERCLGRFKNTGPILTPRFIPSCTDGLMKGLKGLQREFKLPVQSHLSESKSEVEWVKELCPESGSYGGAYNHFGLLGGADTPTIMAHCVWPDSEEMELIRKNGVYVAHSPQSNANLSSGIAPIRRFIDMGVNVGLASDVASGANLSIIRAMADAIQVSKLRFRLVEQNEAPLTVPEAFYLGTCGGGSFFGKVGCFTNGYEFDAIVIDDSKIASPAKLNLEERLARIIYLSDGCDIVDKFARGKKIKTV